MPSQINQVPKLSLSNMDAVFVQNYSQLVDAVNGLLGFNGEIPVQNHINMNGNRLMNVAAPAAADDAITQSVADQSYSASALQPKLQSGGSNPLTTYRILNSGSQREAQSSFLNDLFSSVPNANAIFPMVTNGSGDVTVSIPASLLTFADGSSVMLQARTDILSVPAQYAISAISCTGNVVSVTCAASGLVAGQVATITGVTPSSFNGTFVLTSSTGGGANLQYQLDLGTVTGSGGDVQKNGVYFYTAAKRSTALKLLGPYAADTQNNRLGANHDGYQIVAVVVITASGIGITNSGGGLTPIGGTPTAGSFFAPLPVI
jgi:hypothetical protein